MSIYLDASALVPLFVDDPFSKRATAVLRTGADPWIVSDFAAMEFASAVARLVRMGELTSEEARAAFATLDEWTARATLRVEAVPLDIRRAESLVRQLDLALRGPDAIHIALAQRLAAGLLTFDVKMAAAARTLGVEVVEA